MLRECSFPTMCHMSGVMCHVSRVMCQIFFFFLGGGADKVVELVGGRSVINVAYPV